MELRERPPDELSPGQGSGTGARKLIPALLASAFVLLAGLAGFARGAYDVEIWGPTGMALLGVLIAAVFAIPSRPSRLALLALAGLVSLCGWSFLSTLWAESVDRALIDSYRLLVYVAAFGFLLLAVAASKEGLRALPLAAGAAGVLAVAVSVLVQLFTGDGQDLFVASRLNDPLGYFNAEGAFFILGFWPLVAAAVSSRSRALAAIAAGGAAILVDLVVLTQSRGALGALLLSAAALVAIHRPRPPVAGALLAVGLGVAVALPALADITGVAGAPSSQSQQSGALAIALGAVLATACHFLGGKLAGRLSGRGGVATGARIATGITLVVAVLAATIIIAPQLGDEVRAFKDLRQPNPQARLFTVGGNRYDYWRVAAVTFAREPLLGVGAGNYDLTYFRERRTSEDIRQPHSLPLQALSELGVVGGAALALFMLPVLLAIWRLARPEEAGGRTPAWVLAASGMFLAWALHSTVDWTHLMPADAALALAAGAVLVSPWQRRGDLPGRRPLAVACVVAICVGSLAGAGGLGRFARANELADEAQLLIARNPAEAESRAAASLRLNGNSLRSRYIRAAALARLGDARAARAVLEDAADREPNRSLTWALLGDLAVRGRRLDRARRLYGRASALNPRDRSLRRLATDEELLRRLQRNPEAPSTG